ncbi:MAG: GPP34 family phosphoprotein [Verrucomicrobia bacterium]|nr:GPP34 family phosphoprotein [Verrucomicrobiota bacterium]
MACFAGRRGKNQIVLSFVEEIVLLALDDQKGKFVDLPPLALEQALAGAVLLELAFQNRIDTDPAHLMLVSDQVTGDKILDPILKGIARAQDKQNAKYWVGVISADGEKIREAALARLVEKGVLKREEKKILWVIPGRRYPMIQNKEEEEVRKRIRSVVVDGAIPSPRDVVLISLGSACQLLRTVLTDADLLKYSPRIAEVAKMDLIGQAVSKSVAEVQEAVMRAVLYSV